MKTIIIGKIKHWIRSNPLFLIFATIFFLSSLSINLTRLVNLSMAPSFNGDLRAYCAVNRVVSVGISPLDTQIYWTEGTAVVPYDQIYRIGDTLFSVALMKLTGLSSRIVTFVVCPMIYTTTLIYAIYFFGRKTELSPKQAVVMLVTFLFINDWALVYITSFPKSEVLAIALGLIGCAFFFKKEYLHSAITLSISVLFHMFSVMIPMVLCAYTILSSVLNRKLNLRHFIPIVVSGIIFLLIFSRTLVNTPVVWGKISPDWDPNKIYTPVDMNDDKPNLKPEIEGLPQTVQYVNYSKTDHWLEKSNIIRVSQYFLPKSLADIGELILYPFTQPLWSVTGRYAVGRVCSFFNFNVTSNQVEDMKRFKLTKDNLFPIGVVVSYGTGLVVLSLLVLSNVKKTDSRILALCAYSLPVLQGLLYFVTGFSLFPSRTLIYVALFFSMVFAYSKRFSKLFWAVASLSIFRLVLWVIVEIVVRGGY